MKTKLTFEVLVDSDDILSEEQVREIAGDLGQSLLDNAGWTRSGYDILFKQEVLSILWVGA